MTATRIKQYLRDKGIKQAWLAKQIDVPQNRLSMLLSGQISLSADLLMEICQVLKVSSELFAPDESYLPKKK